MTGIYEELKTPYKHGIIVTPEQGRTVDCPSVFRFGQRWYMTYIVFCGRGYETWIAESRNLLRWKTLGRILSFRDGTWDANQAGGYVALQDPAWGGSYELQRHDGRYWMTYLGGAERGCEQGKLAIGAAWTKSPDKAAEWNHGQPVLMPDDPDARWWEKQKLFKSCAVHDEGATLGHPYVMYYNAADAQGRERIGMAVSDDMVHWERFGSEPVIDRAAEGWQISGDPMIQKIGDLWVMFYFGLAKKADSRSAFDTFACSYDLVNWTNWDGPHLVEPSEPFDSQYAHKPYVIRHDGVVYHFYCAVGDRGRTIALATSKELPQ